MSRDRMERVYKAILLGLLFGLICAGMATIRKPIPITPLILLATVYNRAFAGWLIGISKNMKIINGKYNPLARGFVLGFLVSALLSLPWGLDATLGFAFFGGLYGLINDYIVSVLWK